MVVTAMNDWGGAQWLIVFVLVTRCLLGAARAMGALHVPVKVLTPWQQFRSSRLLDLVLLAVLIWGGFF